MASVSLALLLQILLQECPLDSLLQFVLQGLLRRILHRVSAAAFGADLFAVPTAHAWAASCIQTFHASVSPATPAAAPSAGVCAAPFSA